MERREHVRLDLRLDVFCHRVDNGRKLASGQTRDISTGGLCMHTSGSNMKEGELISYSMAVPWDGLMVDIGEHLEGFARVLRVKKHGLSEESVVSMQFCNRPKLQI